jgi:hypothetical protein
VCVGGPGRGGSEVAHALEMAGRYWGRDGDDEVQEVRPLSALRVVSMSIAPDKAAAEEFRAQLAEAVARSGTQVQWARFDRSMNMGGSWRAVFGWAVYARERELAEVAG